MPPGPGPLRSGSDTSRSWLRWWGTARTSSRSCDGRPRAAYERPTGPVVVRQVSTTCREPVRGRGGSSRSAATSTCAPCWRPSPSPLVLTARATRSNGSRRAPLSPGGPEVGGETSLGDRQTTCSTRSRTSDRHPSRSRPRSNPGDRAVHRHRRLHRAQAATLGDADWRNVLERSLRPRADGARSTPRRRDRHGGRRVLRDVRWAGAGCAVCARHRILQRAARFEVRAGVHTGECDLIDGKIGGIGVAIGARVGAAAGASEVLVSSTVKDLDGRLGTHLRRRRRARAQRRPRPLAPLPRGELTLARSRGCEPPEGRSIYQIGQRFGQQNPF